jgi:hypothetical protein
MTVQDMEDVESEKALEKNRFVWSGSVTFDRAVRHICVTAFGYG